MNRRTCSFLEFIPRTLAALGSSANHCTTILTMEFQIHNFGIRMGSEGWLCGARYEGGLAVGVDGDWWKLWTYPGALLADRFSKCQIAKTWSGSVAWNTCLENFLEGQFQS